MSDQRNFYYTSKIRVFYEDPSFGPGVASLLQLIQSCGSIKKACLQMNMAYSKAWKILKAAEKDLGFPLLCRVTGGKGGGFSQLTPEGKVMLDRYEHFFQKANAATNQYFLEYFHSFMPKDSFLYHRLSPKRLSV